MCYYFILSTTYTSYIVTENNWGETKCRETATAEWKGVWSEIKCVK